MSDPIKALVAIDAGVDQRTVEHSLPRSDEFEVVGIVEGLDDAWMLLQETPADLLVVACAGYSERALVLIDGAVKQRPGRPVIVLSFGSPNGFLPRVFEAGADDVVILPAESDDVAFALRKAVARRLGGSAAGSAGQAELVCVLGPKGGTGKTLTSTSLAVAMAEAGKRVALVDLDLQFGDVGLCMGLSPEVTIYDLVRAGGTIDEDKVNGYMVEHSSGVRVLLAPRRPDHAALISIEFLRQVYTALRQSVDVVIVDTPPGFTAEVIATIDNATSICMVGMLDSLSLKNTKLGLETLELMGIPADRIKLLLNRARSRVGISNDDVVSIMGRVPDVFVPSDRDIPRSVNEGVPIILAKPSSEAAEAFRSLATLLVAQQQSPVLAPRRRLLGWRA